MKRSFYLVLILGAKVIFWKNYAEAAIEPSPYKTIISYFLTTTCKSYFLVKLQVLIIYVGTWRRFDDDTTSMQLHRDFLSTLKRLCMSKGMQVYKTINSVKSSFLGFWTMVQSMDHVKKVLVYTYFVFCIFVMLFKECFSLILIKKYWKFWILVRGCCNVQLNKAKREDKIFLVIKTIGLIWDTFLSMCV